jgi:putative ABC transport system substrate-binding protein
VNRREFITLLGGAAAWPLAARAQQPAMPVIGIMSPQSAATGARNFAAFRNGLRELGYTEGQNVRIEYRFAEGVAQRYPALVADLVALKPAVILVGSTGAVLAASKVTRTTPLIMIGAAANPVALGLAESFVRPGGNVTGFLSASDAGIIGKRLELLREARRIRFSRRCRRGRDTERTPVGGARAGI